MQIKHRPMRLPKHLVEIFPESRHFRCLCTYVFFVFCFFFSGKKRVRNACTPTGGLLSCVFLWVVSQLRSPVRQERLHPQEPPAASLGFDPDACYCSGSPNIFRGFSLEERYGLTQNPALTNTESTTPSMENAAARV